MTRTVAGAPRSRVGTYGGAAPDSVDAAGPDQEALDAALAVGDFDFANVQHHGTPRERRDALLTGFRGGTPQACDRYLQR